MLLGGIGTLDNQFCGCVAMDGIVHLVLHRLEKSLGRGSVTIVVKGCSIDVGDLLIKLPLGHADLADQFQLTVEVFVREHVALLQAIRVHDPALNGVILHDLSGPLTELNGPLVVDP